VDNQRGFAGDIGDLAHDRIEQEGHIVVDGGDGGKRPSILQQRRILVDGDNAVALV
jgi:hypothetical protein